MCVQTNFLQTRNGYLQKKELKILPGLPGYIAKSVYLYRNVLSFLGRKRGCGRRRAIETVAVNSVSLRNLWPK